MRVLPQVGDFVDNICADISPPLRPAFVSRLLICPRMLPYSIIFLGSPPLHWSEFLVDKLLANWAYRSAMKSLTSNMACEFRGSLYHSNGKYHGVQRWLDISMTLPARSHNFGAVPCQVASAASLGKEGSSSIVPDRRLKRSREGHPPSF